MASTIADLVWIFTNVKVAPTLGDYTNVVTAIDYRITLEDGPAHGPAVWRFGNAVLATTAIDSFVLLEDATTADIAEMAIQMYGQEAFDTLFGEMQAELAEVKANGALDPALVADLPFIVTVATPADMAASAAIPPVWNEAGVYAIGQIVSHEGQLWKKLSDGRSEPSAEKTADWAVVDAYSE